MYIVGNTYISEDIANEFFVCDLEKCKGACCVEGDLGAPLQKEELKILEDNFRAIQAYLSKEGLKAIRKQGIFVIDEDGDYSTPTIGGRECAYSYYDEKGFLRCGIEAAYRKGETDFPKPISCHLYPIRITQLDMEEALNYHRWHICSPACILGKSLSLPLYQFLKEPLIRKYSEAWYEELERQIRERKSGN